jgi:hypothetical protein
MPSVRQRKAAGVPEHVRVRLERQLGHRASTLEHAGKPCRSKWRSSDVELTVPIRSPTCDAQMVSSASLYAGPHNRFEKLSVDAKAGGPSHECHAI